MAALTGVHLAVQKDQGDLVRRMLTKGPDEPLLVTIREKSASASCRTVNNPGTQHLQFLLQTLSFFPFAAETFEHPLSLNTTFYIISCTSRQ